MSPVRGADIPCLEQDPAYDVHWPWRDGPLSQGLTCVFRVKNEARNLPWVIPPMLEAVQHVVLVDNLSDDGTPDVAREAAASIGAADRLEVHSYPHRVSRAGTEHLATRHDSVHSLTHFYNWSFSHVRTAYSMKWDGDMVLTTEGVVREFPETSQRLIAPEGLCVELKWLDQDEFSHWSAMDFDESRAPRKRREWQVYSALKEGRGEEVQGLHRIEAPPGVHVIDYVTDTWLPHAERPLVRRGRRIES